MTDATPATEAPATEAPATEAPTAPAGPAATASGRGNRRKSRVGLVISSKMDKTVVVSVVERVRHARYQKTLQRTKRLYAHDETNEVREGDRVRVAETRPMSALKRWRVVEVIERAR